MSLIWIGWEDFETTILYVVHCQPIFEDGGLTIPWSVASERELLMDTSMMMDTPFFSLGLRLVDEVETLSGVLVRTSAATGWTVMEFLPDGP